MRKLYGVVSYVDEKKICIGGHNDTIEKLKKIEGKTTPLREGNKVIILGNSFSRDIIGKKVIVWAKVKRFKFTAHGRPIEGWNLRFIKMKITDDWS